MTSRSDSGIRIPLQLAQGCVVASIQVDLDDRILSAFRDELLDFLRVSGARGVILDLSGVEIMDREDYRALRDTMQMARLMGARTVLSGLRPGVVTALIDLEVDTSDVEARATLDDAFGAFRAAVEDLEEEVTALDEPGEERAEFPDTEAHRAPDDDA